MKEDNLENITNKEKLVEQFLNWELNSQSENRHKTEILSHLQKDNELKKMYETEKSILQGFSRERTILEQNSNKLYGKFMNSLAENSYYSQQELIEKSRQVIESNKANTFSTKATANIGARLTKQMLIKSLLIGITSLSTFWFATKAIYQTNKKDIPQNIAPRTEIKNNLEEKIVQENSINKKDSPPQGKQNKALRVNSVKDKKQTILYKTVRNKINEPQKLNKKKEVPVFENKDLPLKLNLQEH